LTSQAGTATFIFQYHLRESSKNNRMSDHNTFDVIIVGGSYSGLAAGMALGRALKKVLIIDDGKPCNRQTPYSHNFITTDGTPPSEIAALAKLQVKKYDTITFVNGWATNGIKTENGFEIKISAGQIFAAKKLIFATGIMDLLPGIEGVDACWGISVLHCPYCHGYEVRHEKTGILCNGDTGFDFAALISNWTKDLTLFTNGQSMFTAEQTAKLRRHHIKVVDKQIEKLEHINGCIQKITFTGGTRSFIKALYLPVAFEQHCKIPESLGCQLTEEGYVKIDAFQETTVPGVFACGDNAARMRTVANAVAMGTTAGMTASKKMILEEF
jgi:thioredoxin reductase